MADPNKLFRSLLKAKNGTEDNPVVLALTQDNIERIYCVSLPLKFNPEEGYAILLQCEGGNTHPEVNGLDTLRFQVRVWGKVRDFEGVRLIYQAIKDWAHGKQKMSFAEVDGSILSCLEVVPGQDVTDPETGWATVVSFYELTIRN